MRNGQRIVEVKGKSYVVGRVIPARPENEYGMSIPVSYVTYWSERNGEDFGASRHASSRSKPGTVGAAIWSAVGEG